MLDDELKLTSKSYLLSKLEAMKDYLKEEELIDSLQNYFFQIEKKLKKEVFENLNGKIKLDKICK